MRCEAGVLAALFRCGAAWQSSLVVASGASSSVRAASFVVDGGSATLMVRGQFGWLAQSLEAEGEGSFSIGVVPSDMAALLKTWAADELLEVSVGASQGVSDGFEHVEGLRLRIGPASADPHEMPLNGGGGLWPGEACAALPDDPAEPDWSIAIGAEQLSTLLVHACRCAAEQEENAARAVLVLEAELDLCRVMATDGRSFTRVEAPLTAPSEAHRLVLPRGAADRLIGLLAMSSEEAVVLDVVDPAGKKPGSLTVSAGQAVAVLPLPALLGPDLDRLMATVRNREPLATIIPDPSVRSQVERLRLIYDRPVTLSGNETGLVLSAVVDAAAQNGDVRLGKEVLPASDTHDGCVSVEHSALRDVLVQFSGETVHLSIADTGYSDVLVAEADLDSASVLRAVVGLNRQRN